jgi:ferredoxin/flavodoxin---NADP+ reductase
MTQVGTPQNPLRVAIIGSGPSGFYAAEHLQKQANLTVHIDMYERLPTPYGLVRGGVAPDHAKIKTVTKVYDKIASNPNFRFYGNVNFGTDVTHEDLVRHYHAIIYAVGAQTDKNLGIPGEHLSGSHAATEFVGWYNGHPDYRDFQFDLTQETAVVIGVGNVAMDVTRILARTHNELLETDIADYALEALARSSVKMIYVLGRRGPAQAAFTNPEIKELGEMEGADIVIDPSELQLDQYSLEALEGDRLVEKNIQTMRQFSLHTPSGKPRQIIMRFLVSPVEIIGTDHVEAIKIVHNELVQRDDGSLSARATGKEEIIPAGLVFRSVGYYGVALPGVPFYEKWGIIPNEKGRVLTGMKGQQVVGDYVVGWIKRGPSGIIGTNKPDSVETAQMLLEDLNGGKLLSPSAPERDALENLLKERGICYVTFEDWRHLDQLEIAKGQAVNRPRLKFCRIEDMLNALSERQQADPAGD